eukprot:TRINITY_DN48183_c0_g1_i1.p2 TRINITY_DN48183_c0_g1~~TRINITY_DN48183_c0_g1_i1.p2  ORF type:complete len:114 (+),score=16.79 TRINITY_DN48183_c0_g1_i1:126-467(+)
MISYIAPMRVRCVRPSTLLRESNLTHADVDYLVVDAEGYDVEIVLSFLNSTSFLPAYIQFEWSLRSHFSDDHGTYICDRFIEQRLEPLISALARRGYDVMQWTENIQAFHKHR